jgi:hypothetical protein
MGDDLHKSHGRRYKAYSAAQIRVEGNNTKYAGKKRFQ